MMKFRIANSELRMTPGRLAKNSSFEIRHLKFAAAFTLLEVMIASGILFLCLFAILQLLSSSLRVGSRLNAIRYMVFTCFSRSAPASFKTRCARRSA